MLCCCCSFFEWWRWKQTSCEVDAALLYSCCTDLLRPLCSSCCRHLWAQCFLTNVKFPEQCPLFPYQCCRCLLPTCSSKLSALSFFLPYCNASDLPRSSLWSIGCPNFWTIWLWTSQNALLGAGSSVHTRGKYSCMSFSLYFLSTTIWQMRCCSFQLPSAIASWGMSVFLCVFLKFLHCYLSTTSAPTTLWTVVWGVNKQFLSP